MDEPFAALDSQMKLISQEQLLEIHREYNKSVIYVTHDVNEALLLADRIILLTARPGQIKDEFKVPFTRPRNVVGESANQFIKMKMEIWRQIKEEVEMGMEPTS
jgi:NitT/TauT family transport system ATP-binding protein